MLNSVTGLTNLKVMVNANHQTCNHNLASSRYGTNMNMRRLNLWCIVGW